MTLSLHEISVPALLRGLRNLDLHIDKGIAYAGASGMDESELVQARLVEDMLPFARQVQIACDSAKFCGARLSGDEAPSFTDDETTLGQLKDRIAKTANYLRGIPADRIDGQEQREISFKAGPNQLDFIGQDYLRSFVLPNFYFHATMAYALLRHKGVPLGKLDYLGKIQ